MRAALVKRQSVLMGAVLAKNGSRNSDVFRERASVPRRAVLPKTMDVQTVLSRLYGNRTEHVAEWGRAADDLPPTVPHSINVPLAPRGRGALRSSGAGGRPWFHFLTQPRLPANGRLPKFRTHF